MFSVIIVNLSRFFIMTDKKNKKKRRYTLNTLTAMMLILSLAVIISTVVFTQLLMRSERNGLIKNADARLFTAAEMKREVIGSDFYDRIENAYSVSQNEYLEIVDLNDELCRRLDLQYLWSVLVLDSEIVFTTATRINVNDPESGHAWFFEVHRDPDAFTPALNARPGEAVFSTFVNEWGKGRMVLIPYLDKHGRTFILGASVQLKDLVAQLNRAVRTSILIGFLVFLLVFGLSLLFVNRFTRPMANLTSSAKRMAGGDLNVPLKVSGTRELQSMASSFDQMRKGLKQQISILERQYIKEETENQILTQISKRNPIEGILNQIALFCEQQDPNIKASILWYSEEKKALFHAAAPSLPDEYNALLMPGLPVGPEVGSCGSSAYHKKLIVTENIANDPRWLPYEKFVVTTRKYNLNSCWSQPFLSSDGKLLGTIANYSNRTGAPNENNLKVLEWSTRIAGLAVEQDKALKELISAKMEAEKSNKLKTTFLQNMSHEIRTPLNGIMGFTSLLKNIEKKSQNQEQIEEYISIIQNSSNQLLAIVNDVLEISRIESGTLQFNKTIIPVAEIMEYISNMYAVKIKEKNLEFNIIARDGLNKKKIVTDKEKLFQIIINFMNNALKFTEKGNISFFVQQEVNGISFNVQDTGIGIDPKYHDRVFDRFWQYEAFTKQFYGGTGLGLSISKGLADFCGYEINIFSEKGEGALLSLVMPQEVICQKDKDVLVWDDMESEQYSFFEGRNFLFAEDDETSLLYMIDIIKNYGVGYKWVTNGQLATEAVDNEKFDVVIMDIKMPVMDGLEAIRIIKEKHPNVPILAQSANASSEDQKKAHKAGCDYFLKKPFEPDVFLKAVKMVISNYYDN